MIFIPRNDLKLWTSCTNQVWNLIDLPKRIKPNGYKCLFKRKTNMKSNVKMYNARISYFNYIINRFDFIKNMDKLCVYKG
jgi:hypothetical protein